MQSKIDLATAAIAIAQSVKNFLELQVVHTEPSTGINFNGCRELTNCRYTDQAQSQNDTSALIVEVCSCLHTLRNQKTYL